MGRISIGETLWRDETLIRLESNDPEVRKGEANKYSPVGKDRQVSCAEPDALVERLEKMARTCTAGFVMTGNRT